MFFVSSLGDGGAQRVISILSEKMAQKGMDIEIPYNYYRDDNPQNIPLLTWRSHANALYTNWLDYYVYQNTPYEWN